MRPWTQTSALIQPRTSLGKGLKNVYSKGLRWLYTLRIALSLFDDGAAVEHDSIMIFNRRKLYFSRAWYASGWEGRYLEAVRGEVPLCTTGEHCSAEVVRHRASGHRSHRVPRASSPASRASWCCARKAFNSCGNSRTVRKRRLSPGISKRRHFKRARAPKVQKFEIKMIGFFICFSLFLPSL